MSALGNKHSQEGDSSLPTEEWGVFRQTSSVPHILRVSRGSHLRIELVMVHWFPRAAVTWCIDFQHAGWFETPRIYSFTSFGGWWSEIKVLADPCSLEDCSGGSLPCFSLSFWCCQQSLVFPGLSMHWRLTLVSVVSWCSPFVSPCLFSSYKDTSFTGLGSILMNSFYLTISANTQQVLWDRTSTCFWGAQSAPYTR